MKYRHRSGSTLPYVAVVIASVCFAVLQPAFPEPHEIDAAALADLSWISPAP